MALHSCSFLLLLFCKPSNLSVSMNKNRIFFYLATYIEYIVVLINLRMPLSEMCWQKPVFICLRKIYQICRAGTDINLFFNSHIRSTVKNDQIKIGPYGTFQPM